MALMEIENLRVTVPREAGPEAVIVDDVSFALPEGEITALIGESGSGKTTIALSLMGYAKPGCRLAGGAIRMGETDILQQDGAALRALRGHRIAYVPQSAAAAFNPAKRIMDQVVEPAMIHRTMSRAEAEKKAVALFRSLALPDPETLGARYPHQFSGGQLQRLAAAMAMILDPRLVILDEPTTALDVTTQIEVLHAFKQLIRDFGTTGVYVSHDLAVVAQMADQIVTLRGGKVQEIGRTEQVITAPESSYTRDLLAAARPRPRTTRTAGAAQDVVLEIEGLTGGYGPIGKDGRPRKTVVEDIGLTIRRGANLGVIGESGCGKSTLARMISGLLPASSGVLKLDGFELRHALAERSRAQLRDVQILFQMADTALNPAATVGQILGRPLSFYHGLRGGARRRRVAELLDMVQLSEKMIHRRPGQLSGGQKQRLNLARALAAEPRLILCDEITSALDTVVAAAILDLLASLQKDLGLSYMFISHDLSTVRSICDEVMVLYAGRMVEYGTRAALETAPWHPYTRLLLSSIPEMEIGWMERVGREVKAQQGTLLSGGDAGLCPFRNRCLVRVQGLCDTRPPPMRTLSKGSVVACHLDETGLAET
ncbi:ABC transporter ATP-binding protein [Salipiger abyssi]|uniref:ABC transporter ATP-binding protein n=1 Tax=Salipiger abyssi TaxID=1250539 RepID=UPI00405916AB